MKKKYAKHYGGGGGQPVQSIPEWAQPYVKNVAGQAESLYGSGELSKVADASALQNAAFNPGASGIIQAGGRGLDALDAQQGRLAGLSGGVGTGITDTVGAANSLTNQQQQGRLSSLAMAPSPETLAAQKANILYEAQKGVAGLNTGFGGAGTLGSARQAVMQGGQNAETTGRLAKVDADYENQMFQNRLQAEGALSGAQGAGMNIANSMQNSRNQDFGNRLQAEGVLGNSVGASGSLAGTTASGLANLGNQQRGISQQQADAPWQGLNRYASTIFGQPDRVQSAGGGK
jgi:hypothetical protein